jgi:hypothetical protein
MRRIGTTVPRLALPSAAALAVLVLASGCGQGKPTSAPAAGAPGAAPSAAASMPAPHPSGMNGAMGAAADPANPHPAPNVAYAAADFTGIKKAEGGQTVAELFEHKAHLAGKPVTVRGKVVKVNSNIMGKTWVHLRDGTGTEGKNDVTVTTTGGVPNIGETALVKGTLAADKDLGMGYKYEVIIEDATLQGE